MPDEQELRPDPDALPRGVAREEKQRERGRLRVFFGMCPGVGKTCAMLEKGGELLGQGVEVVTHVVRQERKPQYRGFRPRLPSPAGRPAACLWTFAALAAVALASQPLLPWLGYRAVGIILVCTVMGMGTVVGFGPTVAGAAFSSLIWNYFFIPPLFTFKVEAPEDLMMCLVFFPAACITGLLAARIRKQGKDLVRRERRAGVLYTFSQSLAEAGNAEEIAACAYESLQRLFGFKAAIMPKGTGNRLAGIPLGAPGTDISAKNMAVAAWSLKNRRKAGQGTDTLASSGCLCLPLRGRSECVGVLMLFPPQGFRLDPEQEALLDTLVSNLGVAFEREAFAARGKDAEVLRHSEHLHQALLNSVSHELRTPLTGLIGAASALRDEATAANPEHRALLAQTIEEGAERLNRVVENLLDMSRIAGGALKVKEEVFELGEFASAVLERGRRLLADRPVHLAAAHEIFARGDYRLLEHVLLNIFANVAAYTPEKSPLTVRVLDGGEAACLEVADEGPGIPEEALGKIFERFYRVPGTPVGGTGLGLSIAKALIEAQNGSISVHNREPEPGCVFILKLPKAGPLPVLDEAAGLSGREEAPVQGEAAGHSGREEAPVQDEAVGPSGRKEAPLQDEAAGPSGREETL